MRVLEPGHRYALDNLKGEGESILQFFQDPELHDGIAAAGPSTQEVLRAVVDRVKHLEGEKYWELNAEIIACGRRMIALFEVRALLRKVEKGLPIESFPTGADGHVIIQTEMWDQ